MDYKQYASEIIALKEKDLKLRNKLAKEGKLGEGYNSAMELLHNKNAKILNTIMDTIGYPTISKVGKDGSEAAWLIIQHSISQPSFMKKCAALLEDAVRKNDADPVSLAYLHDRIATMEGRPQRYGTQFDWDENGELSPQPFNNLAKVNGMRKSIGLNTIEEQTAIIRQQAKLENQFPPSDHEARRLEIEDWRRSVGWIK